jgi:hypothetical protein
MKAEEKTFYQPLMAKKEAREGTMEAMEEHHIEEEGKMFKSAEKALGQTRFKTSRKNLSRKSRKSKRT